MDGADVIVIGEDHALRTSDRYGPGGRWLRRWSLNEEGLPVCAENALDTATAQPEALAAAEAANAAVRAALDVPEPADAGPPPTLADYQAAVERHVEATAGIKGYRSAESCAGYAASTVDAWAEEAAAFIAWRDKVWLSVFATLAAVQGGAPAPTVRGLIAALPAMEWPA